MSESGVKNYTDFVLPSTVVTKIDVAHLVSEAERVDNEMTAEAARAKVKSAAPSQPMMSERFTDFLEQNGVAFNQDDSHARSELIRQLRRLKDAVPVIHMTFATEADGGSLQRLAAWLRDSVHPLAVIETGLQPSLVAGVYVRTPNHVHDMSLRAALVKQRGVLVKELEALRGAS